MADESQQSSTEAPKNRSFLGSKAIFAKVLEVILSVFAIGLIVDPFNSFQNVFNKPRVKLNDIAIIYVTLAGYVIINSIFIISHFLGDRLPKRTVILFASLGAMLHVVAGSMIVHSWRSTQYPSPYYSMNNELYPSKQYLDMLISSAVFVFVNAAVFLLEIFINIKYV